MNIHKTIVPLQAVKEEEILHLGNWYVRKQFSNDTFVWKTMYGGGYGIQHPDELEKVYQKLQKPVEVLEKYDLKEIFDDQIEILTDKYDYSQKFFKPLATHISKERVQMLFCGIELVLNSDGTYWLCDTTGG